MGKVYDGIDAKLARWIQQQPLFLVATSPLAADGRVNLSPKGETGTFRVVDEHAFAYLDLIGSGIETVAHLRDNGRICVMFCSVAGKPTIVRLHGVGRTLLPDDPGFDEALAGFGEAAAPQKSQVLVPQPGAEKAMSGLEPAAGLEPAQLGRVVGGGEHEVVVPRATLALRRASTPVLILERVSRDDVHHRKRAEKQDGGQPRAERDEHGDEAHEHNRPLKHVHEGTA